MKNVTDNFSIKKYEEKFKYVFKNPLLLCEALTHTSFSNEYYQKTGMHIPNNERLEFLGDSVLGVVISTRIFERFPEFSEGKLSKIRSAIVCENSLAECFSKNGLKEFLVLGRGEELSGGRDRFSILADCFEAVIGAIYLDGGFDSAEKYIGSIMQSAIEAGIKNYNMADVKTLLQEVVRREGNLVPHYEVVSSSGPDHNRLFNVRVDIVCNDGANNPFKDLFGEGTGQSKKEAEQKAALNIMNKGNLKNE